MIIYGNMNWFESWLHSNLNSNDAVFCRDILPGHLPDIYIPEPHFIFVLLLILVTSFLCVPFLPVSASAERHIVCDSLCEDAVFLEQLPRHLVVCRIRLGWRMRTNPDNVLQVTQTTPHKSQDQSRWSTQSNTRHAHAALLQGRKSQPERTCYNLVNEQAQSEPQRLHARHQGTPSPQISFTFRTLYLRTNHLAQRSSSEDSLVHVHRCS